MSVPEELLKEIKDSALAREREIADEEALDEEKETIDARASSRYREIRTGIMRGLMLWYRDLLVLARTKGSGDIHYTGQEPVLKEWASGITCRQSMQNVRVVEEMNRRFLTRGGHLCVLIREILRPTGNGGRLIGHLFCSVVARLFGKMTVVLGESVPQRTQIVKHRAAMSHLVKGRG